MGGGLHIQGPILHPAQLTVHRRMYHSYFALNAKRTFPSTDEQKEERVPAQTFPGAILTVSENNSATDQEKLSPKSVTRYSDATLRCLARGHCWQGQGLLPAKLCYIVLIYCMAVLHFFHVND